MTREHILFLWLLLINFLVVVIYLVFNIHFRGKKDEVTQHILNAVVMLLCPVVGALFFVLGTAVMRIFMRQPIDIEDVIFSKERVKTLLHADEERDSNMAPMEEALAVSDTTSLRRLMMNFLQGDIQDSLHSLVLGLNSEDSETAHYAASVLSDELNNFRVKAQTLYTEMMREDKADKERCRCACSLISLLARILPQQVFTNLEQRTFVLRLDEVCEFLNEHMPEWMQIEYFEAVILQLNEIGEYGRAEEWCARLAERYPDELASYICPMKLYFTSGQRDKFFERLNQLKKSNVVLNSETLDLVRMFGTTNG